MSGAAKELAVLIKGTGDWAEQGHCVGTPYPDLWFSSDADKGAGIDHAPDVALAIRICSGCPARDACLQYALDTNQGSGVWGGLTVKDRERLRKRAA